MAFNFLKLARILTAAGLVSGTSAAYAQTAVTNTASATIRINPYSVTATYDKSSSAAVQANGIAGYSLASTLVNQNYINPLDAIANYAGTSTNSNLAGTTTLLSSAAGGNTNVLRNTTNSLMSVANGNAQLADIYTVTDASGTFSLDISSKNADKFTRNNLISAPTNASVGVDVSGASTYSVSQQGVAGIGASVISATKVVMDTDSAGGGSSTQIGLTSKSLSNGVQETYSTSGSVAVDGASAYLKANTTNHIALNAVNAKIDGIQTVATTGSGQIGSFHNTDIVASTLSASYKNADGDLVRDQKAVLAAGSYVTKDASKGATSIKIANDPADELRTFKQGAADPYATGFAKQSTDWTCTTSGRKICSSVTTNVTEAAPGVNPVTGAITLPDYSTQQLTASGVAWVDAGGTSASRTAARNSNTALSKVSINSAAGGTNAAGTNQNVMTGGGFGNTVNLQTTFDMTVFGR